jgi:threonine efflux protein
MNARRESRLAVVEGVTSGSFLWSVSATLGLGAIMVAHVWVFAMVRYLGAGYLLYLTLKSARAALRPNQLDARDIGLGNALGAYSKGLAIYLTNPKAILFFGSLYSIGVPHDASMGDLAIVIGAVAIMSFLIFHGNRAAVLEPQGHGRLFAITPLVRRRFRARLGRRGFEGANRPRRLGATPSASAPRGSAA